MATPQSSDSGPGHCPPISFFSSVHVFLPSFQQPPLPPSNPPTHPNSLLRSLKTWLPDKKKNHQITAASGAYDDGTTPRGFSPLSPNPLNGCSNHNVLTLWSQVPIPLLFWLSPAVCLSVCPSLSLFLTCSSPDLNWQACGSRLPWQKDGVRPISERNQPASN